MKYILITLAFVLTMGACRIKDTSEQRLHSDSLSLQRGRALDILQVLERYDTLGRVLERQITQAREQDSTQLLRRAEMSQSKQTHSAPVPSVAKPWFTSWRALLLLFALGLMLGAYAWHRLRKLFP